MAADAASSQVYRRSMLGVQEAPHLKSGYKRNLLHAGVDGAGRVLQVALHMHDPNKLAGDDLLSFPGGPLYAHCAMHCKMSATDPTAVPQ